MLIVFVLTELVVMAWSKYCPITEVVQLRRKTVQVVRWLAIEMLKECIPPS